jgi:hypothetical protein
MATMAAKRMGAQRRAVYVSASLSVSLCLSLSLSVSLCLSYRRGRMDTWVSGARGPVVEELTRTFFMRRDTCLVW